jgi:gluconate 2-dehydrogenase alpha chain
MKVVALERGGMRSHRERLRAAGRARRAALRAAPRPHAEHARDTLTIRNNHRRKRCRCAARLVPAGRGRRRLGRALERPHLALDRHGVQGAHLYEERYGKNFIPADMTIQDWGITYAELEPYYDKFERTRRLGQGGKPPRQGRSRAATRSKRPRERGVSAAAAHDDPREPDASATPRRISGYHPFPRPSANASRAYTNPDGAASAPCPVLRLLPALRLRSEREGQRAHDGHPDRDAQSRISSCARIPVVTKVLKDPAGKRVTGVTLHERADGEEFEQPAAIVLLAPTPSTTCT